MDFPIANLLGNVPVTKILVHSFIDAENLRRTSLHRTDQYLPKLCECVAIQMKATERYFPVLLFIMLNKVLLSVESVDEILRCGHSNKSYWAVLFCGAVYFAVQGGFNVCVCNVTIQNESYWAVLSCGVVY